MVAAQTERDAAITAKTEMEGQLKVADEKLLEAEERFLKVEELTQEVELKRRVLETSLDQNRRWLSEEKSRCQRLDEQYTSQGSSSLAPPVASSSTPAPSEVASSSLPAPSEVTSSSLPAPPEVTSSSLPAPPKVVSPAPAPLAPSNTPDAASEDLLPSEGC
ncbi:hypothetical protein NE237_000645 [Protea cynaroides]|uniref:Uncharacterized protein n=1 Tax=Protea cynaroides TaxID=273540 RepID=A0A9Q0QXP3_9MAGN|nr:hypothetical protein NE237_000645 [Protea cynaroides]